MLWRKVRQGLSAGRVQSVAMRLVVERERERMAFRSADYWDVTGVFGHAAGRRRRAGGHLRGAPGRPRRAPGRHRPGLRRPWRAEGRAARSTSTRPPPRRSSRRCDGADFTVRSLETKPYTRRPAAPFTTSTLQQEASRKLRMGSRQAMRVAQALYENGYITYMRTDSPALSGQAVDAARRQAAELYGPEYVPDAPRSYATKSKGAQEAHEAIRPAGD